MRGASDRMHPDPVTAANREPARQTAGTDRIARSEPAIPRTPRWPPPPLMAAPCASARSSLVTEHNEPLSVRTSRSVVLTENVLKEEPEPGWRLLFREDFTYQREDIGNGVQVKHLHELPDVLCVAGPRGERLHREEMFW